MKPGETIAETAVREVKEETGLDVEVVSLVGIYSNPNHVVEYSDGEVRQQFSVCFACRRVGGELATSDETSEVGYFSPDDLEDMDIHPSIRLRIQHFLEQRVRALPRLSDDRTSVDSSRAPPPVRPHPSAPATPPAGLGSPGSPSP